MRHALLMTLILPQLLPALRAQDLEPTLERAANRLVARLAVDLAGRDPEPSGLALESEQADDRARGVFTRALLESGFRVRHLGRHERVGSDLLLRLESHRHETHRELVLRVGGGGALRLACGHGDAEWVDRAPDDLIVVAGDLGSTRDEAIASAREKAWLRIAARLEGAPEHFDAERELARFRTRLFVAERSDEGRHFYRAHLGIEMDDELLVSLRDREAERVERELRKPFIRIGAAIAWAVFMVLAYLFADLRTRGYWTGALRLLFGSLLLVGCAAAWRIMS